MKTRQLQAQAITVPGFGDYEVLVFDAHWDEYNETWEQGDPIATASLDDISGEGDYDPDTGLTALGYRVIGEWTPTDFGEVVTVEPQP